MRRINYHHQPRKRGAFTTPTVLATLLNSRLGIKLETQKVSKLIGRLRNFSIPELARLRGMIMKDEPDLNSINRTLKKVRLMIERTDESYVILDLTFQLKHEASSPLLTPEDAKKFELEQFWRSVSTLSSPFGPGFDRLDEVQRVEIAIRFLNYHSGFVVKNIERFGITDEYTRYAILETCSEHKGGALEIAKDIKSFNIADKEVIENIAKNCAQYGATVKVDK